MSHSLPGPEDIFRASLPNGITVLSRPNFNSPSVVISGFLQAGSLFETDEKLGLADFAASALLRGNARRNFQQTFDALESVGAALSFSAGAHSTGFGGRALVEDLPLLVEILSDALRTPTFPSEEVEKLRTQLLTGLSIRAQDTADMASLAFDEMVFAGHPYARDEEGTPETIHAITRADLEAFCAQYYGPAQMVLAIVGAIEPQQALQEVERALGNWQNPGQPNLPELPPLRPMDSNRRKHIAISGKAQSDLVIGASGPGRRDPEYFAASLGNSILGQFGMMGRIGDVVREKSGLAYYAYSSLSAGIGPGSWDVSAGVNPSNLKKASDLILEEITRFVEQGVTSEELGDSQANFIGRLPLSMESNSGVAGALLNIERHNLGLDYYLNYEATIRAIAPDQVVEAARKYLNPAALAIASAGPEL